MVVVKVRYTASKCLRLTSRSWGNYPGIHPGGILYSPNLTNTCYTVCASFSCAVSADVDCIHMAQLCLIVTNWINHNDQNRSHVHAVTRHMFLWPCVQQERWYQRHQYRLLCHHVISDLCDNWQHLLIQHVLAPTEIISCRTLLNSVQCSCGVSVPSTQCYLYTRLSLSLSLSLSLCVCASVCLISE